MAAAGSSTGAAILASTRQSIEERRGSAELLREGARCLHLNRPLVTSVTIARGAAAESLYEAQFAAPVAARAPAIDAAPMPRPIASSVGAADPGHPDALAECVARTHPDLIRVLLGTDPATPAEQAALGSFSAVFGSCAAPGTQMQVGRRELRGLLAEALYRWSVVQRDGPASPLAAAPAPAPSQAASGR